MNQSPLAFFIVPRIHKTVTVIPKSRPTFAFPNPAKRGLSRISFLASTAFTTATGPRMIPKQKMPTMEYVNAFPAASHGSFPSLIGGGPLMVITLQDEQYFCPSTSTRQSPQKSSAQPVQRSSAVVSG